MKGHMGASKGGVSRRGGVSELARFYNEAANSDFWYKVRILLGFMLMPF